MVTPGRIRAQRERLHAKIAAKKYRRTNARRISERRLVELQGRKRHRLTKLEIEFIEGVFEAEKKLRKAIAKSHAKAIAERGIKYAELPDGIKKIVNDIYWTKNKRFHRLIDELVGTMTITVGLLAEIEPIMETGAQIAEGHALNHADTPSKPLKLSRRELKVAIAESGNSRIAKLRVKYPRVGVDVNGNLIFRSEKRSQRIEKFITRHLNIRKIKE